MKEATYVCCLGRAGWRISLKMWFKIIWMDYNDFMFAEVSFC